MRDRSVDEQIGDALFTGLRLRAGLDFSSVSARYDADLWSRFEPVLRPLEAGGRLTIEGQTVRLTREGMLVANEIMQAFV